MAQPDSSLSSFSINVHTLTEFVYDNTRIFVYASQNNTRDQPKQWKFFYVPVSLPVKDDQSSWVWVVGKDVRMNLLLGNEHVDEAAFKAINRKYEADIAAHASSWDVSPLMIDSMTAAIIEGTGSPVKGVSPCCATHPNAKTLVLQFRCTTEENARAIARRLVDGDCNVEVAYHFGGQFKVAMNLVSINAEKLSSVLDRTIADGENITAKYIHRNQDSKFISYYTANVAKLIYRENSADTSELMTGLKDDFTALFQEGLNSATELRIEIGAYNQIWSSDDLSPDRLTHELNKQYLYNREETERHNNSDMYYNDNSQTAQSSFFNKSKGGSVGWKKFSATANANTSGNQAFSANHATTTHNIVSSSDIKRDLLQQSLEVEWDGEKIKPKAFRVFKLSDLADRLQVAIISKQLFAEKSSGAIVRTFNGSSLDHSHKKEEGVIAENKMLKEQIEQLHAQIEQLHAQIQQHRTETVSSINELSNRMNTKLQTELSSYQRKSCANCRNCHYLVLGNRAGPVYGVNGVTNRDYYHLYGDGAVTSGVYGYGGACTCSCHNQ